MGEGTARGDLTPIYVPPTPARHPTLTSSLTVLIQVPFPKNAQGRPSVAWNFIPKDGAVGASWKKLTPETWLDPEPIMSLFVQMGPGDTGPRPMSGEDWVEAIAKPSLADTVPEEVKDLFETARGALVYGYFFYPLYALGMGQLFRVAEAATTHKCKSMGAPRVKTKRFSDQIDWLISRGVIPERESGKWDAIRKLRNAESHSKRQTLDTPGAVIGMLMRIAEDINALFRNDPPSSE